MYSGALNAVTCNVFEDSLVREVIKWDLDDSDDEATRTLMKMMVM